MSKRPFRHRWFQYRLSTLLLFMSLAAVLVTWQRERISRWVESLWSVPVEAAPDDLNPSPEVKIWVFIAEVEFDRPNWSVIDAALQKRKVVVRATIRDGGLDELVLSSSPEWALAMINSLPGCSATVFSSPQIMTMDNQAAIVQVGQCVRATSSKQQYASSLNADQTDELTPDQFVGLYLSVKPRISKDTKDNPLTLEIDVDHSELCPPGEDEVDSFPSINTTRAQTTVSSLSGRGQTLLLRGIGTNKKREVIVILAAVVYDETP